MKNNERVLKLMSLNGQAIILIEQVKPLREDLVYCYNCMIYLETWYGWTKIAKDAKKDFLASLKKQSLLLGKLSKVNAKRKQYRFKQTSKQTTLFN